MDTPPPETVSDQDVLAVLTATWNLRVDGVRYVPMGAGSYHWVAGAGRHPAWFVTVDDLDTKPWIASERATAFHGLRSAYETARTLQHDLGLQLVVGPVETPDASVIARLSDQHSVAVFPFVEGRAGHWGGPLPGDARTELLRELAALHQAAPGLRGPISRGSLELPERHVLVTALGDLDRPWHGGPFAEPARRAFASYAGRVSSRLARLDDLAGHLRDGQRDSAVVTHGEPHPGNLITTDQGLRLIDWDTAALALAERDLWMLDDGSAGAFAAYEDATGTRVCRTAVSFYGLAWTLSDIASFLAMFRSPHQRTRWLDQKWGGFLRLLGGARPAPYG